MSITKQEWETLIDELKSNEKLLTNISSEKKEELVIELSKLVEKTIVRMANESSGEIGVLFSGGVDSTLISYILHKNNIPFTAASIGFQDNAEQKFPDDIVQARIIAKKYGFNYVEKIYNFEEVESLFLQTTKILGKDLTNAINVGVGSVEVAGINLLKETNKNITTIFGGLGSEEIYAGYKRHADSKDKHAECWFGLKSMYERDLMRDFAIEKSLKIKFAVPFLDKDVISFSMNIPIELKLNSQLSKLIIRDVAVNLGLDENFSKRPKKAAQYGSRTDKAIGKLARKNGFSLKKDYLNSLLN